ncbi:hypothetical protein EDD85DRAFT_1019881 [Armillaria nabsnona]|nr:hypothetical protein EDD85DRAFT_1019881 [Armillaria nabsnona]
MTGFTDQPCPTCTLVADLDNYKRILSTNDFSIPDNLNPYVYGNLFPTSIVYTEIQQSVGRLEKQLSCFEQVLAHQQMAISQVASVLKNYEEAYTKTRSEQLRAQEIMDLHKSALYSPIRSLPVDLLVFIFQLTSPNAAFTDQFPWIATRVCRQWRAVAHSNPILWSEINLDSVIDSAPLHDDGWGSPAWGESDHDGWNSSAWEQPGQYSGRWGDWNQEPRGRKHHEISRTAMSQRVVRQALGYSGSVPLTFSLHFADVPLNSHKTSLGYLDVFIAQAARWRNVKLRLESSLLGKLPPIRNSLPILESLDLYLTNNTFLPFSTDVFVNAPSLRNLTLTLCSRTELIFPWKQLKELSICLQIPLSENYYLQILRNGSLLEILRLQQKVDLWCHPGVLIGGSNETNLHTHRVTTLPYLRVLEFDSRFISLLDFVCLPKLSSLIVCGNARSVELVLSSLIERSHSVIKKLSFSSTNLATSFIRLLRLCPSLTSLSLISPILKDKAFFCAMSQKGLLPSLEDFSIHDVDISNDGMIPIIEMLEAHQCCLKQFHLTLTIISTRGRVRYGTIEDRDLGTPDVNHLRATPSATSKNSDRWLAPSEKAQLRALSNAGMKIRLGKHYRTWDGSEIAHVNLDVE